METKKENKTTINGRSFTVGSEHVEFDKYFRVDSAAIEETEGTHFKASYKRYKLVRKDAVAVLLFNEDTGKIMLIKQFRYPIAHKVSEPILEVVAGKIDDGETPKQAAVRELLEEVGFRIEEERLGKPIEMFASPGYSTEKIYVFMASVKNSDRDLNFGGGVATEHENIETVEMSVSEFQGKVLSGEIQDSKTLIASMLIK
jgi:nudix-type nucleoside diphosphatase (YffH/AdpP family)